MPPQISVFVPSAVGLNYLRAANRAVFNLINLELRRVPKMLEDLSCIIGNRNFHI